MNCNADACMHASWHCSEEGARGDSHFLEYCAEGLPGFLAGLATLLLSSCTTLDAEISSPAGSIPRKPCLRTTGTMTATSKAHTCKTGPASCLNIHENATLTDHLQLREPSRVKLSSLL